VQLQDCERPDFEMSATAPEIPAHPRLRFTRYLRSQVLSVRNLWRANAAYGAYDLTRITIDGIRRQRSRDREDTLARDSHRGSVPALLAPPGLAAIRIAH
jgi:hypothetical protein